MTHLGINPGNARCSDEKGNTFLHFAAQMGKLDAAKVLIQQGTSLRMLNDHQQTALDAVLEVEAKMEEEQKRKKETEKVKEQEKTKIITEGISVYGETLSPPDKLAVKGFQGILPKIVSFTSRQAENTYETEKKKERQQMVAFLVKAVDQSGYSLLHDAAEQGNLEQVKLLLGKGAPVAIANSKGVQPLHLASAAGHLPVVQVLLTHGASICQPDISGQTPLAYAIKQGASMELVKLLVSKGKSCLKSVDKGGNSLLLMAAQAGKAEILKFLIDSAVPLDQVDTNGQTALHLAAGTGDAAMVDLLLGSRASVTIKDNQGRTALFSAISESDNVQLVKKLVERGSDIHVVNREDVSLLIEAVTKEKIPLVEYLLNREIDVTRTGGKEGTTALHQAAKRCNLLLIKLLQQKGGQVSAQDNQRNTVLHVALENSCPLNVVDYLLNCGADVNLPNSQNATSLHLAAQQATFTILEVLLGKPNSDLKVDAKNSAGRTPLQVWISQGGAVTVESLNMFISKGANLNVKDGDESNLALEATRRNNSQLVSFLVEERGVEPNGANKYGWTALHEAAKAGNVDLMGLFLEKKASLEKANEHGWTALHVASSVGQLEAVKFLIEHGANVNALSMKNETALKVAVNRKQYEVVRYYVTLTEEEKVKVIAKRSALIRIRRQASTARRGISPLTETSTQAPSSASRPASLLNSAATSLAFSVKYVTSWISAKVGSVQEIGFDSSNSDSVPSSAGFSALHRLPIDGTLLLFDLLARHLTGQKYVPTVYRHQIGVGEARSMALQLASQFEDRLQIIAKQNRHHLASFDSFKLFQAIEKGLLSEQILKIKCILLEVAKNALPSADERLLKVEVNTYLKEQFSKQ